ncbi:MAG: hypothetical protein LBC52_03155 [Treponema sp.]|jgi:hypothetical protein|nr:hypothetical protein [Treponema sp.]
MKITKKMKKNFFFLTIICLTACKEEPDLPTDPHVSLVNPFIGVWNAEGEYWLFKSDGTGGRANSEKGPFSDDFSFFIYAGQDVRKAPLEGSLVILEDDGASILVTRYVFEIEDNLVELTEKTPATAAQSSLSKSPFTLERVSGAPAVLDLTNQLIGEWSAMWDGLHDGSNKDDIWSIKYRADGTVKTYHLGVRHQFENAYALRGDKLVIFGLWRFSINPVTAQINNTGVGKYQINETQEYPMPSKWIYTKVDTAEWL